VHTEALRDLQRSLANCTVLKQPQADKPFTIHTDASGEATGATITQDGHPLAFFSAKLNPAERRYPVFDKEALAIVKAIKAYKHWLTGNQITVYTDHQPLVSFLHITSPSPRQARWSTFLSEFDLQILYIPGAHNTAADCLSRPASGSQTSCSMKITSVSAPFSDSHPWFSVLSQFEPSAVDKTQTSLSLTKQDGVWWESSTGKKRLVVPPALRSEVFHSLHDLGHPGVKKMHHLISSKYFWPNMKKEIQSRCQSCTICQSCKITRHQHHEPQSFPASRRFQTVHVDIVGPLTPSKNGTCYLLTMIDRFSRWLEVAPLRNISAQACADAFLFTWVSRFGVPETIVSDQGTQFESALFHNMLDALGIKRLRSTAYHPQTNGAVERSHRTLKNALRTLCSEGADWEEKLPLALLSLRTTISSPTQTPPCKLILGTDLSLPDDYLVPRPRVTDDLTQNEFALRLQNATAQLSNWVVQRQPPASHPPVPAMSDWVWLRDERPMRPSLAKPYRGPYKVVDQSGPVVTIDINGTSTKVNYDRLKQVIRIAEQFDNPEADQVEENEDLSASDSFTMQQGVVGTSSGRTDLPSSTQDPQQMPSSSCAAPPEPRPIQEQTSDGRKLPDTTEPLKRSHRGRVITPCRRFGFGEDFRR
jgi:cleavage and polyadenylation specificity factor subunit 1